METFEMLNKAGCDMEVVCGKKWNDLLETEVDGIRFCTDCEKSVFYTTTPAELRLAAERKLCVYIEPKSLADMTKMGEIVRRSEFFRKLIKQKEANALRHMQGPTLGVVIIK